MKLNVDGLTNVLFSNPTGCSSHVTAGTTVGIATEVQVTNQSSSVVSEVGMSTKLPPGEDAATVCSVTSETDRKERLLELINKPSLLNDQQTHELLTSHHTAFSLDDLDRARSICLKWRFTQVMNLPGGCLLTECRLQFARK